MQDLRTLAIFVKVAERLSFVRAAADLGITQSGVSNAISRLEDQIGTPLLARTTRRVSLTEHGAAYFERCRQALAELEEAELVLKNAQLKPSGNLRIDMPVSFGRLKVVPLLGAIPGALSRHQPARHFQRSLYRSHRGERRCQRQVRQPAGLKPDRAAARRRATQRGRRAALLRQIRRAEEARGSGRAQLPGVHLPRYAPRQGMALRASRRRNRAAGPGHHELERRRGGVRRRAGRLRPGAAAGFLHRRADRARDNWCPSWTNSSRRPNRSGSSIRRPGICRRRCACSSISWWKNSNRALEHEPEEWKPTLRIWHRPTPPIFRVGRTIS